jgi:hypothetical protein
MATTLFIPFVGSFTNAKSRAGSHISVTAVGKYPPTRPATLRPNVCEDRRIKFLIAPFLVLPSIIASNMPPFIPGGELESEPIEEEKLFRLSSPEGDINGSSASDILNIWTVSVAELTQRSVDMTLKVIEYILEGYEPRRNWYNFAPPGTENTLTIVPLSDAVANRVPSWFNATHDNGALCASMTLMSCNDKASNISTSPVPGWNEGACDVCTWYCGDVGDCAVAEGDGDG